MKIAEVNDFASWRNQARYFLQQDTPPEAIIWQCDQQESLFPNEKNISEKITTQSTYKQVPENPTQHVKVSKEFLTMAAYTACHRDNNKWALLYKVLWRISHGEKQLLSISTDILWAFLISSWLL